MQTITVIVETPKGSPQKYDFDEENKWFKLNKVMPAGMVFPFDFGFIPNTKGGDGDPLDVVVISEFKTFPGCAVDCRIVGGIMVEQTERDNKTMRNDRLYAVPEVSEMFKEIESIDDLPKEIINQLEKFFINYNEQAGKTFNPIKKINAEEAYKLIDEGKK